MYVCMLTLTLFRLHSASELCAEQRKDQCLIILKSIKSLITLVLLYEESHRRLDCVLGWDSMFCVNQA